MHKKHTIMKRIPLFFIGAVASLSLVLASCGDSETKTTDPTKVDPDVIDSPETQGFTINGKLFSIPSPFQTAELIKNSGAPYDAGMLNSPNNTANYSTRFHKALNLGVYGADLGYVTMYDNTNEALSYLNSVQSLSEDLDVGSAFSKDLIDRFSANLGVKDSMLGLVSDAYRAGDEYLKTNDRHDVAALILAGGWIEALYFAIEVANDNKNQAIIDRVGEQKTTLGNLIEMLENYNNEESYNTLIEELRDLYTEFENIQFTYSFVKPETDKEHQTTTIKCSNKVTVTDENLAAISEKVKALRTKIVDSTL